MERFSDNYPDISRPNFVSTGGFEQVDDDQWDFYLASVFGHVPTLEKLHAANPGKSLSPIRRFWSLI